MASYYKRPVGLRAYRKWVFTGIHRFTTPVSRGAKNNVTIEAKRNSKNRSLDPTSKECHSRSAKISPKSRVLQHPIHGSQEKFSKIETGHQSQTPESILGQEIIQNGSLKGHDKSDEAGGLGSVHRSVRCLHAYTNPAKSSEVFEVCRRKPSLAVQGSSVRANDGASNFHKSFQCGCPIFATTRNPDLVISRRLDSDSSGPRPVDRPPKCGSDTLIRLGFLPNMAKSELTPSQEVTFIGARFLLQKGLVTLPQDRALRLKETLSIILSQPRSSAYLFLRLLGLMASCLLVIPWARLQMRPIQMYLLAHWRPSKKEIGNLSHWKLPSFLINSGGWKTSICFGEFLSRNHSQRLLWQQMRRQ